MAKVYLTTTASYNQNNKGWALGAYNAIQKSASFGPQEHHLVDDPSHADIILFAELGVSSGPFDEFIRYHPLFKKYHSKCYVFMNNDSPIHLVPGVYTALEKKFYFPSYVHSGFYLSPEENPFLKALPWNKKAPYLYSFIGALKNHSVRQELKKIQDPLFFCKDTDKQYIEAATTGSTQDLKTLHLQFINNLQDSQFILCPRGVGSSSMRLFETMQAGRVPVVISDQWVEPIGPSWQDCIVRIPEKDVLKIPILLRNLQEKAPQMACKARQEWEKYFSLPSAFNTITNWCLDIQAKRTFPTRYMYYLSFLQLLRPKYTKRYLKTRWQLWQQFGKIYI